MNYIRKSADITLPSGYSEYLIDTPRDLDLTFVSNADSQVYIRILNSGKIRLRTFATNGEVTYLIWNAKTTSLEIDENHQVGVDGMLKIAYGEINQSDTKRSSYVGLSASGAKAEVSSASLVGNVKEYKLDVVSLAPHTSGIMNNYAVVLEGGKYQMKATGSIIKGAYASKSHQTSRALCFDEKQTSMIEPNLLIDEMDVEASHATSVGRVNEEQLYYMQSRGLTTRQCTALISAGYLLPVAEVIDDEKLKATLKEELEGKIDDLCSM